MTDEKIKTTHIITHPIRHEILVKLAEQKMFIEELAQELRVDRRLVSFHLTTLLNTGLVSGEWAVSKIPRSKGKAARYFELTPEARKLLEQIDHIIFP